MLFCAQCGSAMPDTHQYCGNCGNQIDSSALVRRGHRFQRIPNKNSETVGSIRRFGQLFGLDPRIAFLTLIVDRMCCICGDVGAIRIALAGIST